MLFNLWTDEVLSCDYIILQTEITMVKGNKIKTIFLNVNDCCLTPSEQFFSNITARAN
jgi:hypothetical protein